MASARAAQRYDNQFKQFFETVSPCLTIGCIHHYHVGQATTHGRAQLHRCSLPFKHLGYPVQHMSQPACNVVADMMRQLTVWRSSSCFRACGQTEVIPLCTVATTVTINILTRVAPSHPPTPSPRRAAHPQPPDGRLQQHGPRQPPVSGRSALTRCELSQLPLLALRL